MNTAEKELDFQENRAKSRIGWTLTLLATLVFLGSALLHFFATRDGKLFEIASMETIPSLWIGLATTLVALALLSVGLILRVDRAVAWAVIVVVALFFSLASLLGTTLTIHDFTAGGFNGIGNIIMLSFSGHLLFLATFVSALMLLPTSLGAKLHD